jgi:hypothetical protein
MRTRTATPPKMKRPGEANPLEMLLITGLLIVGLVYGITAFSAGDALWFLPSDFNARPISIELYYDGNATTLSPGHPTFERIVAELNQQMDTLVGYHELGLRPHALEESLERYIVLVLAYDEPLHIRSRWNIPESNQLLIPITGSWSGQNRVYLGRDGRFGSGAFVVQDLSTLVSLVRDDVAAGR